eukprot:XP_008650287.1 uncharacterized protein LOC103631055 [Zea mays]
MHSQIANPCLTPSRSTTSPVGSYEPLSPALRDIFPSHPSRQPLFFVASSSSRQHPSSVSGHSREQPLTSTAPSGVVHQAGFPTFLPLPAPSSASLKSGHGGCQFNIAAPLRRRSSRAVPSPWPASNVDGRAPLRFPLPWRGCPHGEAQALTSSAPVELHCCAFWSPGRRPLLFLPHAVQLQAEIHFALFLLAQSFFALSHLLPLLGPPYAAPPQCSTALDLNHQCRARPSPLARPTKPYYPRPRHGWVQRPSSLPFGWILIGHFPQAARYGLPVVRVCSRKSCATYLMICAATTLRSSLQQQAMPVTCLRRVFCV